MKYHSLISTFTDNIAYTAFHLREYGKLDNYEINNCRVCEDVRRARLTKNFVSSVQRTRRDATLRRGKTMPYSIHNTMNSCNNN